MKVSRKNLIKYIAVGLVLAVTVFIVQKVYQKESLDQIFRYLSDCFLIPGILLTGFYFLAWLGNDGMFDGIGYASKFLTAMFIPSNKVYATKDGFYKYKQEKAEKRTEAINKDALFVGLAFLLIAIIFYVVFLLVQK